MTEDIKSLIEKINQEGVEAAEAKAGEIKTGPAPGRRDFEQSRKRIPATFGRSRREAEGDGRKTKAAVGPGRKGFPAFIEKRD